MGYHMFLQFCDGPVWRRASPSLHAARALHGRLSYWAEGPAGHWRRHSLPVAVHSGTWHEGGYTVYKYYRENSIDYHMLYIRYVLLSLMGQLSREYISWDDVTTKWVWIRLDKIEKNVVAFSPNTENGCFLELFKETKKRACFLRSWKKRKKTFFHS